MNQPKTRKQKKSETLQVRLPYETKRDFLNACREDRISASELLRRFIVGFLSGRGRPQTEQRTLIMMIPQPTLRRRYLVAGLAAAVSLPVVALGSAVLMRAMSADDFVVTADELRAGQEIERKKRDARVKHLVLLIHDRDKDGQLSAAELDDYQRRESYNRFTAQDWNYDGVLDHSEVRATGRFAKLDADRDERIKPDELLVETAAQLAAAKRPW